MKNLVNAMYPNRGILYANEVCELIGYSLSTLRGEEQKGLFPKKIQISTRRVGYRKDLVIQVLEGKWTGGAS